ncbi:MAG: PIN domain-containing protein [Planctomycetales bacterium]
MILVDTSVIIDALRRPDPRMQQTFVAHAAAICGVTRAEVLYGARDDADYGKLRSALASLPQVPIPESLWDRVGYNLYLLRTHGVTVPFQDVVIATVAIVNGIELWTRDGQFAFIRSVLPALRLFQEPP